VNLIQTHDTARNFRRVVTLGLKIHPVRT
jgi:hypothetical protein